MRNLWTHPLRLGMIFAAIWSVMIMSLTPLSADDIEVTLDRLKAEHPWLANIAQDRTKVEELVRFRLSGWEWYEPALEPISMLPPDEQEQIAKAIYDEENRDPLVQELRIPVSLIDAALAEALSNGADPDPDFGDLPAFKEVLHELRMAGKTSSGDTFKDLQDLAPETTAQMFFVYSKAQSIHAYEAATAANEAATAEYEAIQNQLRVSEEILEAATSAAQAAIELQETSEAKSD